METGSGNEAADRLPRSYLGQRAGRRPDSDELAHIQDAVNAVDATIAPYGVAINDVTDPTQANALR